MMFNCDKCGSCCRQIGKAFFASDMAEIDGVCKYLDRGKNLCRIYDNRPTFCNVDAFYDMYFSHEMSREEYYHKNKKMCEELRRMENAERNENENAVSDTERNTP